MKTFLTPIIFSAFTLLTLHSCQTENRDANDNGASENKDVNTNQETPVKMIEQLVGDWELEGGDTGNRDENQRLTFTSEARYILRRGNEKVDSGAYRMNEQLRNLYLESESNEEPREYEVNLDDKTLTLSAKANPATKHTYRRSN